MELTKAYDAVNSIIDSLDFNSLFEGFHKYSFALYTGSEIILDGKSLPYHEDFRGNSALLYNNEYIAIWNMEFDPVDDMEQLAYCLVHEMFHCHQQANGEKRYPSDFELLNYPNDTDNFIKKHNENRYLAEAYERRDMESLQKFASIRDSRYKKYPSMVLQEFKAETLEGIAEYIGLKALKLINPAKYHEIVGKYLGIMKAESSLMFDVRRISYYTGAVYFLCMERLGIPVSNAFDSRQTAYEQNIIRFDGVQPEISPCDSIARSYAQLVKERETKINEHIEKSEYTECSAFICGYDPMNMFRVGNIVYCSHFVFLNENGEIKPINSAVALKLADGSNQSITGYYL